MNGASQTNIGLFGINTKMLHLQINRAICSQKEICLLVNGYYYAAPHLPCHYRNWQGWQGRTASAGIRIRTYRVICTNIECNLIEQIAKLLPPTVVVVVVGVVALCPKTIAEQPPFTLMQSRTRNWREKKLKHRSLHYHAHRLCFLLHK